VDAVAEDTDPIFGLGRYEWTLALGPARAGELRARLADLPESEPGIRAPFRMRPTLIRRRDREGSDYFQLAKPTGASERLRLAVKDETLHVTQTMSPGHRLYGEIFSTLFYLFGLGGVIAAFATGQPGGFLLLVFPAFLRAAVTPLVRRRTRWDLEAYLARELPSS